MNNPSAYPPYPSKEEYLLEQLLRNVISVSYALSCASSVQSKTIYVVPNGEYTGSFLTALQEAGFTYQLIESGAANGQTRNGNYPVADLQKALNPRRWRITFKELINGAREYAVERGKIVRVVPSEQTSLLVEALEKEQIPYYIARPKSFFQPEKEYSINLPEIEVEGEEYK